METMICSPSGGAIMVMAARVLIDVHHARLFRCRWGGIRGRRVGGASRARRRAFRCRSGMRVRAGPSLAGRGRSGGAIVPARRRQGRDVAARHHPRTPPGVQGGHRAFAVAAARLPSTPASASCMDVDGSIGRRGHHHWSWGADRSIGLRSGGVSTFLSSKHAQLS